MAIRALFITEERSEEIAEFLKLSEFELKEIRRALQIHDKRLITYRELVRRLSNQMPRSNAELALRTLMSLRKFADSRNVTAREVVSALAAGVREYGWPPDEISRLERISDDIVFMIASDAIHSAYKILDLYLDVDHHSHDLRITTVLTPIFNEGRNKIEGFVLKNDLRVVYSDRFENESLFSVTLRRDDIERLRAECEKALKKIFVAEELAKEIGASAIIYGSQMIADH